MERGEVLTDSALKARLAEGVVEILEFSVLRVLRAPKGTNETHKTPPEKDTKGQSSHFPREMAEHRALGSAMKPTK